MGYYDTYLVCENGHGVNNSYHEHPEFNEKFCSICGAKTIYRCPNCKKEIEGKYNVKGVIDFGSTTSVPSICKHCGEGFPWRSILTAKSNTPKSVTSDVATLKTIMERFHLVVKQMRVRYNDRPTLDVSDEYDVQDLLHSLLKIYYDDIRTEEWNPSYAGGATRCDFLLKKEKIVIEVKKTRSNLKGKQLGEQLIIDIAKYAVHPDCKLLFCFVYDPDGYISNPAGIESDLNRNGKDEMNVKVIIIPKGH